MLWGVISHLLQAGKSRARRRKVFGYLACGRLPAADANDAWLWCLAGGEEQPGFSTEVLVAEMFFWGVWVCGQRTSVSTRVIFGKEKKGNMFGTKHILLLTTMFLFCQANMEPFWYKLFDRRLTMFHHRQARVADTFLEEHHDYHVGLQWFPGSLLWLLTMVQGDPPSSHKIDDRGHLPLAKILKLQTKI